jgi:two-component system, chemotaxis family, sensor kinase CheA
VDSIDFEALRKIFVADAVESLDELERVLVEIEARPDDRELLQTIRRVTHNVKGNALSLGLQAFAALFHAMEDVLDDLAHQHAPTTSTTCGLLLECADAARAMLPAVLGAQDQLHPAAAEVIRKIRSGEPEREASAEPASIAQTGSAPRGGGDGGGASDSRQKNIRVDVAKLDRMVELIGEIAVSRSRIAQRLLELGGADEVTLRENLEQNDRLFAELAETVRWARMVPIEPWLQQYARAVRDISRAHGKEARLVTQGGDVEADMAVLERLRDPLTHLIRNAIDHGIEPPEARLAQGKDPNGTITLAACYEGGAIALRVSDDGAGLSDERIAARARAAGRAADVNALSAEQLRRLVFEPGFSTAPFVSDLSGRGVGLDVVQQRIEALQGSIRLESVAGLGTSFMLRLPLTLATINGLSVGVGGERYVIPLDIVVECLDLPEGSLTNERLCLLNLRGKALPCVHLRDLLDIRSVPPRRQSVVVFGEGGRLGGLIVDSLGNEVRAVIKPLGRLLHGIPGVAGSTLLSDGTVALVLDVTALLRDIAPTMSTRTSSPEVNSS